MFRLSQNISIGNYSFAGVVNVEVESSWDMFTDTCKITFPRKVNWKGKSLVNGVEPLLKKGDSVSVDLGYDDENKNIFNGYVHKLFADTPVTIDCQDEMWLLKQNNITKSFADVDLKTLLTAILPSNVPFKAPTLRLGQFRISNTTAVKVLDLLKRKFFLKSFFKNGTLYCGFAFVPELQETHIIKFDVNVVNDDLEYIREDEVKVKLKMISIQPDNSKVEYEVGDVDGEQRTMHYYDKSKSDLKAIADEEIKQLKYEGYRGTLTVFGRPVFYHGDVVDLRDETYPEKDGKYLIKKVTTNFSVDGGFKQTLELHSKI